MEATDYPASLDMATFAQAGVKGAVNGAWVGGSVLAC